MVTDVRMPGLDGLELIRRLHDRGYRFAIIVMTGHADPPLAVAAMKAGATEFLEKPFREERLLKMVRHALAYNEESVRASQKHIGTQARLQSLSRREHQGLDALVGGKANKAIAHDLNISICTVKSIGPTLWPRWKHEAFLNSYG